LLPPKTVGAAKSLSLAGNLAIPHLVMYSDSKAASKAMCIRTLIEINTEEALFALESFVPDHRKTVQNELVRGLNSFVREEYIERVLKPSGFPVQDLISIFGLSLNEIAEVVEAESVKILSVSFIDDHIKKYTGLTSLWNINSKLREFDIKWLECQKTLEVLHISGENIKNINLLNSFEKLSTLSIEGAIDSNVNGFTQIPKLVELGWYCHHDYDLRFLMQQDNLRILDIIVNKSQNLDPIYKLSSLQELHIRFADSVVIDRFENIENLEELKFVDCHEVIISEPEKLVNLKWIVFLHCNKIPSAKVISHLENNFDVRVTIYHKAVE